LDGVVHLAGESIGGKRWSRDQKARILDSRTKGTSLLARALASLDAPPPVLLSGSAVGIYGYDRHEPVVEDSPPGSGFLAELCLEWEAATAPAEAAGSRVAHLRTGLVLDPHGGLLPRLALPFKLFVGGRLGSGRQWMSWITLADEVRAIRFLLDHPISGPVNLTAPAPVTNTEMAKTLGRVLHRPSFVPVPAFAPKLVLGKQMGDELVFASQRALPAVLQQEGFEFEHPALEPALRALLG
jgi:uncharacterized protein (TIGR01777 family)